jgi:hypothetical protein
MARMRAFTCVLALAAAAAPVTPAGADTPDRTAGFGRDLDWQT